MRRSQVSLGLFLMGILILAGCNTLQDGPEQQLMTTSLSDTTRYLIVFQGNGIPNNAEHIIANAGGTLVSTLPSVGLGFATSADPIFAERLGRNNRVAEVGVEPRYSLPEIAAGPTVSLVESPLDPEPAFWDLQWNIRRVHAPEAWETTTGSHDTVVAVIDTGVAWNHPDLGLAAFGGNVVYTACFATPDYEDLVGYECSEYPDLNWHGTHVAATVAGQGLGVAGVGPDLGIASYNVFELIEIDEDEFAVLASFSSIAAAMLDAAEQGFEVINMSLGAFIDMSDGRDAAAIWTAQQRLAREVARAGVTTVVSAGNAAFSLNGRVKSLPGGVAANTNVAATGIRPEPAYPHPDADDVLAFYSNWGASVEIAAPGGDFGPDFDPADPDESLVDPLYLVLSAFVDLQVTNPEDIPDCVENASCTVGWLFAAGTSMAAPHVSGVAGLVRDEHPRLNANQVATRLTRTAESLGDRQLFGHGMVNAFEAVGD